MNSLKTLFNRLANTFRKSGAAHSGQKPVRFISFFREADNYFFEWHSADHSAGEVLGPFPMKELAMLARDRWVNNNRHVLITVM
jgi:hypothetical protein